MAKQRALLLWMREKKTFATHDVLRYGVDFFYDRADRQKRIFLEQGLIRKLSDFEKECRELTCKDACYEINKKAIENYLQPKLF